MADPALAAVIPPVFREPLHLLRRAGDGTDRVEGGGQLDHAAAGHKPVSGLDRREAAEGSKYCIGHAHQAKPSAQSKEKDDGHCWAVTAAGTRCKLKKVGDTDYCALHAADKKPAKPVDQCCAMTWEGTRCTRKPDEGCRYCAQHRKQPVSAAKKSAPQPKKK